MIRRRRHSIDLLPLLDVFMVVLFVFATIQEKRLDDTTHDAERLEQQLARARHELEAATLREQAHAREHAAGRDASDRTATALADAQDEASHLRGELERLRQRVVDREARTQAELAHVGLPAETLERLEVLSRLLDKHGVTEIEIVGQPSADGTQLNRCCYRDDPLASQWRPCGLVPSTVDERERWLDDEARALAETLRRTKGGNALTLVRQDAGTSHGVGRHLADLLRARFSDQDVVVEEVGVLVPRCTE